MVRILIGPPRETSTERHEDVHGHDGSRAGRHSVLSLEPRALPPMLRSYGRSPL